MPDSTRGAYGCTSEWDWPLDWVAGAGRTRPRMPGLLCGRHSMKLSDQLPIGPSSLSLSKPKILGGGICTRRIHNYRIVTFPLSSASLVPNWVVKTGNCIMANSLAAKRTSLDMLAQGRASIFPQENGAPGRDGNKLWCYSCCSWCLQRWSSGCSVHTFSNFWWHHDCIYSKS